MWIKSIGGTSPDYAYSLDQTLDGGYIITGSTNDDVSLIKTDTTGTVLWAKTYGGANSESGWVVKATNNGGYIIAASTYSFGAGNSDIYLISADENGDTLWTRTYGGTEYDDVNSIQQTPEEGFILVGSTKSYGAGQGDVYLIKVDSMGDTLWTRTYGFMLPDAGNDVQITADSGYIIVGMADYNFDFSTTGHIYLIKTDKNGDTLWTKKYGGALMDLGFSVKETLDGGYIITGHTKNFAVGGEDVILVKTDVDGNLEWEKTFGGAADDYGYSVLETADSSFVVTGFTNSFGAGLDDVYLIKTNSTGDTLLTMAYGGPGYEAIFGGSSIVQNAAGGYTIAGYHSDFGSSNWEALLIKTDDNGITGCGSASTNSTMNSASLNLINTPTTIGSGGIIGNTATIVGNMNLSDSVLCFTVSLNEKGPLSTLDNVVAYPNPFSKVVTIKVNSENKITPFSFSLYDQFGRIVKKMTGLQNEKFIINREGLSGGMHIYKIMSESGRMYTGKLVIQ